uniref:Sugar phosphate transporter domain-containing protein n=1 Tax=Pyramimonas obovata TaxID=1411642 RepID=A0A7S0WKY0_9CHLO|mmetsp:Transcript_28528/g.62460  ORF Transcript_28528/g.62460 Transcript_28528/m.62460 type:complete len:165 (+) Transcript_28528:66-560(+)
MVLGAIVAGLRDFSFDAWGYFVVFASNGSTALYLATISRLGKRTSLNSFGLMWCNGLICAPILLIVTFLNGDLLEALSFEYLHTLKFQLVLLLSCLLAFALNYTIFLNTAVNSALTQTVCGNLKDAVVIVIGFQSFSDARFDPINMVGILLGIAGSVMYAVLKL